MRIRVAIGAVIALAIGLVACGGGGGGGSPAPPVPQTTSCPFGYSGTAPNCTQVTQQISLGTQATSAPFPATGGYSGAFAMPSGSGTLVASVSGFPPSPSASATPVPALTTGAGSGGVLFYITLTAQNGSVTLNGLPGVVLTLPGSAPAGPYFLAYFAPNGQVPAWVSTTQSGVTNQGGNINIPPAPFPQSLPNTLTLANGQSLILALYVGNYIPPINVFGCVGLQSVTTSSRHERAATVTPIGNGDSYTFSGTLSQTIVRTAPCPQPTATTSASVAIGVSLQTSTSGTTTSGTETTTETDTYPLDTTTLQTVASIAAVTTNGTTLYTESSEIAKDGNGDTIVTTYPSSAPLQYAQTPEKSGNTWTGSPPATVSETMSDGTSLARTYAPSPGVFYTETDTIPGAGTNVITVNTDGSGSYLIGKGTPTAVTVSFTAPASGTITATFSTTVNGKTRSTTLSVPAWFTPGSFYTDGTQDLGPVSSLPSGCPSSTTFTSGGQLEEIVRTIALTDPILGYIEKETITTYDQPNYNNGTTVVTLGPVCAAITDTVQQYYDWSLTSNSAPVFVPLTSQQEPLLTNTISESFTLQTSGLKANSVGRQSRASAQAAFAEIAARAAGIRFARAMERAVSIEAFARAVQRHGFGGF